MTDSTTSRTSKLFMQAIRTVTAKSEEILDPLSLFAKMEEGSNKPKDNSKSTNDSSPVMYDSIIPSYFRSNDNQNQGKSSEDLSSVVSDGASRRSNEIQTSNRLASIRENNSFGGNSQPDAYANTTNFSTPAIIQSQFIEDHAIQYLTGEQKVMNIVDSYLLLSPGNFIPGMLFMSNYRIVFIPASSELRAAASTNVSLYSWLHIPLAAIDKIERERKGKESTTSGLSIIISCKDVRQHRINIKVQYANGTSNESEIERAISAMITYAFPNNMRYLFAFSHSFTNELGKSVKYHGNKYECHLEFARLGVLESNMWRITTANSDYKLCNSYPQLLLVPRIISDEELFIISNFRSGHRLPIMCWGDPVTGASMWRSSQPKAGVSGTCMQDEKLLDIIAHSCSYQRNQSPNKKYSSEPLLHIVDLRSRASAMANRAAGAGYESQTSYPNCRLDFYNITNIHGVRDSFRNLTSIIINPNASAFTDLTFSKQVEDTQWLTHIRSILKASWDTALLLMKGSPVLVHCSHGWDRTSQVCAIAQLFLEPYYRTLEGFRILIEKEWCSFGHPFQMRSAHTQDKATRQDDNFSPIFLQFLDSVWQLVHQNIHYFEFNPRYLLTIADHIYSGRFGNFFFSSDCDRDTYNARETSADLWTYLDYNRNSFINPLYLGQPTVLPDPLTTRDSSIAMDPSLVNSLTDKEYVLNYGLNPSSDSLSGQQQVNPSFINSSYHQNGPKQLLIPSIHQLLRNVTLWTDYFLRWASVPSQIMTPHPYAHYLHRDEVNQPLMLSSNSLLSNPNSNDGQANETVTQTANGPTSSGRRGSFLPSKMNRQPCVDNKPISNADYDLCSIVTSDDHWESAYRMEREKRKKMENMLSGESLESIRKEEKGMSGSGMRPEALVNRIQLLENSLEKVIGLVRSTHPGDAQTEDMIAEIMQSVKICDELKVEDGLVGGVSSMEDGPTGGSRVEDGLTSQGVLGHYPIGFEAEITGDSRNMMEEDFVTEMQDFDTQLSSDAIVGFDSNNYNSPIPMRRKSDQTYSEDIPKSLFQENYESEGYVKLEQGKETEYQDIDHEPPLFLI